MLSSLKKTLTLADLWVKGYQGIVVVDFSVESNPQVLAHKVFEDLCNYRKKVRTLRLNPLYSLEWYRIERTKIVRISTVKFILKPRPEYMIDLLPKKLDKKLPELAFKFPNSTYNLGVK